MSVKEIKAEELRQKGGEEGIVFQGDRKSVGRERVC